MNICVMNGSPRGKYSVTLQTVLYLQKRFPEHTFTIVHVGSHIKALEKDMSTVLDEIKQSSLLLFSYPVYTFLAPSQLHRFIELLKDSGLDMRGKYVTQITTSKHFYDVTAHRYIEDNAHDMGLHVIHGLSADMDDLLTTWGQDDAEAFLRYVLFCVENGVHEPTQTDKFRETPSAYIATLPARPKKSGYDTVIVADLKPEDNTLRTMVEDFIACYPYPARIVNIAEYPFQGGCLGCFHCAGSGQCIYQDGFDRFLRENIQKADAIVYAFTIRDHSMGSRFKTYDDRQFCNGHRTVTEGMPFGYIINGNYEDEPNLQMLLEARCEVGHNFLAGAGHDAASIDTMSARLSYALENHYSQPRNFFGVGGMKIFRDLIWLMRGLMKADHEYYKKHGVYDFPQKKRAQMIKIKLLGVLVRNPKVQIKMGNKMNEAMITPYRKIIDSRTNTGELYAKQ